MTQDKTTVILLAIEPDESLAAQIRSYKRRVQTLVGKQMFVDQPPHMTLYLASFRSPNEVQEAAGQVARRWTSPQIEVTGWHVFPNDPLTGNNILVCDLAASDADDLRVLQRELIDCLAPLRDTRASLERLSRILPSLTDDQARSAKSFGYPYVGSGWHPHFTIASVRPEHWTRINEELIPDPPACHASCSTFKVFWLVDGEPCVLASFPLRRS